MKAFFLVSLLVIAASASPLLEEHAVKFQAFKMVHGKSYLNQVEETKRFSIFRDNVRSIEEHNARYEQGLVSYKQKITKFADQTKEEFIAFLNLFEKPTFLNATKHEKTGLAIPKSKDWTKEQVTAVKDQGQCGSCWAFSVTGSTEAAYYRKNGKLVSLSEQQLVDCSTSINFGCRGGYLDYTFPYVEEQGLQSEESYPYKAVNGTCKYDSSKVVTKVNSFKSISQDEDGLMDAVGNVGPVSVAMDASYLHFYDSGILDEPYCSSRILNHAVLAVGYGTEDGKDFWIIKNSWGAGWGEKGYFKMARGKDMCGITQDDVYPIIN